jgi:hypothetical protein
MASSEELIAGVELRLGKKSYTVPPLNLKGLEQHEAAIERAQLIKDPTTGEVIPLKEKYNLICDILLTAIQRNYPEIELEYLKEVVDLGNVNQVFAAVLGQSGFARTGEAKASV